MGQKMACLGHRGTARSRQDESKEVGGVGSKRASSGCNGVHHVWWGGLIFRLLDSLKLPVLIVTGEALCSILTHPGCP